MYHLEDYLEEFEQLPLEVIHNLTLMRELDLSVQNNMDVLQTRIETFFGNIHLMKEQEEKNAECQNIIDKFNKAVDESGEKINLALELCDLINRCIRKFKYEIGKFKDELETNNPGITAILEKRVEEYPFELIAENHFQCCDPYIYSAKVERRRRRHRSFENRTHAKMFRNGVESNLQNGYLFHSTKRRRRHQRKARRGRQRFENMMHGKLVQSVNNLDVTENTEEHVYSTRIFNGFSNSRPTYVVEYPSADELEIAEAVTKAILAEVLQMQKNMREENLEDAFETIDFPEMVNTPTSETLSPISVTTNELEEDPAQAAVPIPAVQGTSKNQEIRRNNIATSVDFDSSTVPNETIDEEEASIEYIGANEERYCHCNEVAFGDMVACDNKTCPFEWYHYSCVDVTEPPKGKWYCPQCILTKKKRGARKPQV